MYELRDQITQKYNLQLIVHTNPDGIAQGINPFTHGSAIHTDVMKTQGLKQALDMHGFNAAFGGVDAAGDHVETSEGGGEHGRDLGVGGM